jgi:hypothetical protein
VEHKIGHCLLNNYQFFCISDCMGIFYGCGLSFLYFPIFLLSFPLLYAIPYLKNLKKKKTKKKHISYTNKSFLPFFYPFLSICFDLPLFL